MIKAVSFQGTQPVPEKKEPKKSHAAGGFVTGAVVGAGASLLTPLGKGPQFKDVDTFVRSDKMEEALKAVPEDKAADVAVIRQAKEVRDGVDKVSSGELKRLFPEGTKEVNVSEIVKTQDELDGMKSILSDEAQNEMKTRKEDVAKIEEAASKLEKGKPGAVTIGDEANAIHIVKYEADVVSYAKGTATKNGEKLENFVKNSDSAVLLEQSKNEITVLDSLKNQVEALGITKDTTLESKLTKEQVEKSLKIGLSDISETAKPAFENIKSALPKKLAAGKIAMYTIGAAVVGALIGGMMKKKEN
ncbi:MAG: hypothetical protein WCF95_03710 [bacterium]